jgi:hypothetical protein
MTHGDFGPGVARYKVGDSEGCGDANVRLNQKTFQRQVPSKVECSSVAACGGSIWQPNAGRSVMFWRFPKPASIDPQVVTETR